MTDRKKPGVAFWATVAVVVALLAYPLSFGPACWLVAQKIAEPKRVVTCATTPTVYMPVGWVWMNGPVWLSRAIYHYGRLGMPKESVALLPVDLSGNSTSIVTIR
jgi:hypothetical protein